MLPSTWSDAPNTPEKIELLGQKFVNTPVGFVAFVQKVDDDDIVLLSVAVAATDALFDSLRIPRKVVVHDDGAELEVDAFGRRLRRQQDRSPLTELLDDGRLHVRGQADR